jgi:hypothetical protein
LTYLPVFFFKTLSNLDFLVKIAENLKVLPTIQETEVEGEIPPGPLLKGD